MLLCVENTTLFLFEHNITAEWTSQRFLKNNFPKSPQHTHMHRVPFRLSCMYLFKIPMSFRAVFWPLTSVWKALTVHPLSKCSPLHDSLLKKPQTQKLLRTLPSSSKFLWDLTVKSRMCIASFMFFFVVVVVVAWHRKNIVFVRFEQASYSLFRTFLWWSAL